MATTRNREPFIIFNRSGTLYAKFWDPESQDYSIRRSTRVMDSGRKSDRAAAADVARRMLNDGLVRKAADEHVMEYVRRYWRERKDVTAGYRVSNLDLLDKIETYGPVRSARLSTITIEKLNLLADHLHKAMTARSVQRAIQAAVVPLRKAKARGLTPMLDLSLGVDVPTWDGNERGRLTLDEVKRILAIPPADYPDPREVVAALLATLGGLRRGELRALRWRHVNANTQTIRVEDNYTDIDGFHKVKSRSQRTVQVPAALLERLAAYKKWSPFDGKDHLLLFGCAEGGRIRNVSKNKSADGFTPCAAAVASRGFKRVLSRIGIDEAERRRRHLVLHGGRHTFASLAVERISVFAASKLTGHRDIRTLQRYAHPEDEEARRFSTGLNDDLSKKDA